MFGNSIATFFNGHYKPVDLYRSEYQIKQLNSTRPHGNTPCRCGTPAPDSQVRHIDEMIEAYTMPKREKRNKSRKRPMPAFNRIYISLETSTSCVRVLIKGNKKCRFSKIFGPNSRLAGKAAAIALAKISRIFLQYPAGRGTRRNTNCDMAFCNGAQDP
jgi:hypothetical protein